MQIKVPLIKGDTVDNNVDYRDALPVNMYGIPRPILDSQGYLINFFGISSLTTGTGLDRGAIWVSTKNIEGHYRVSGNSLLRIESDSAVTNLGEIPGSEQVAMDYSFNNLAIVANGELYYYSAAIGLRKITDADIGSPIDVTWVDGYFFLTDGEDIYHSDITDEESYLPLDFSNAQFIPDSSKGLGKNEDNNVLVFGEFSTEYFINVGTENFAFQRIPQKAQKIGLLGTHCKREMNGKWYVLGRRKETAPSFHVISLGSEQSISTRETDKVLAEYTPDSLDSVTVDTLVVDDIKLVVFHLPNHTLMFNESVADAVGVGGAWSILKSDINGNIKFRAKDPILDNVTGKWVVGDNQNSNIGYLDKSICTQYGNKVEAILYTPFINLEGVSVDVFEIDTIPGIAPSNDATVFISQTQNGRTYSTERTINYGDNLSYEKRFRVRALGYNRDWSAFKIRSVSNSRMSFNVITMEVS